jgi:hypothetical protein
MPSVEHLSLCFAGLIHANPSLTVGVWVWFGGYDLNLQAGSPQLR